MRATRRFWGVALFGLLLVGFALLADQPVVLVGAAGVGAWLIAASVFAMREFIRTDRKTSITCSLGTDTVRLDGTVPMTLTVERSASAADCLLDATIHLPEGFRASETSGEVCLSVSEIRNEKTMVVECPIAGGFTFPQPQIHLTDQLGLFQETIRRGDQPYLRVQPEGIDLHIGQGGDNVQGSFGEHTADRPGPGVEVRELREYIPGDSTAKIDWKATARLGDTYVRETEATTDRRMTIVLDHRERMTTGRKGETMFDYAKEVGLGLIVGANEAKDPVGLWTVGDEGITNMVRPDTTQNTYTRAKTVIYDLTPTTDAIDPLDRTAAQSRRLADRLQADGGQFASALRPFLADSSPYVRRVRNDPLIETVRQVRSHYGSRTWISVLTTDTDPVRLREVVRLGTKNGSHMLLFLTPTALFEPTAMTSLDDLYNRYLEFEELRREIDRHPRVTAFEVAPGDRLTTLLADRRASKEESTA